MSVRETMRRLRPGSTLKLQKLQQQGSRSDKEERPVLATCRICMQILYIARESFDAESAANVLRDVVPDVEVLWAARLDQADVWIDRHHDLAALLLDVQVDDRNCGAFLTSLRRRGVNTAIVVVTPDGAGMPNGWLSDGADDWAEKGESFSSTLKAALDRALVRAHGQGSGRWDHLRLPGPTAGERAVGDHLVRTPVDETAVDRLAECQTAVEAAISLLFPVTTDSCSALSTRLADVEATFDAVTTELADCRSQIEQLTGCEAELTAQLSETDAARVQNAERRAELESRLAQETASLTALERRFAEARSAAEDAARSACDEKSALDRELADCRSRIEQLSRREAELASQLSEADAAGVQNAERRAELESRLAQETASRAALERRLAETCTAAEDAARSSRDETLALSRQIHALSVQRADAEHALAQARRNFQETLGRVSSEHAAACGRFDQKLCDADLALDSLRREHSWAVAENERLTGRATELASQLDESRAAILRQFEESPLPMCRCTRDGRLTSANPAFLMLVGHSSVDDLRNADFAETVFESAGELGWLIERSVSSAAITAFETTWRTKEGTRLSVRLSASAKAPDVIEIAAEDLTGVRSLEERLGPAQRMESVGRLASEVAVTCANLLGDVHQDVQRWLKTAGPDASLRHQGEMLLDEVTRASGFLRQLAVYGDEQASASSPVDLNKVLRDLGPVLKRVAGDEVDFDLPRHAPPLVVDVQADRVERLLVNLAAYGRERMPFGGRLKIELATVTLDQTFLDKYPNVRRGRHALITATEIRRTTRAEGPLRLRESTASLGVDLGALQGLIRECGGHLWVTAVPRGDMEVRIHLPLRSSDAAGATTRGITGSLLTRH